MSAMKNKTAVVANVLPGSIAEEAGIEKGDRILSINGEKIRDIFDYRFLTVNEELNIEILKPDGEIWEVEIEKEEYEDLGIEFDSFMMDEASSCTNKCIFCFIDQLPRGMRKTLYFKDDDSRLSFLTGNYVTLTNMKDEEIDRIIRYRMSPINISVHTTNPELRVKMLNNRFAGRILDTMKKLVDGGITLNCQIVLCRNINDGSELERTLADLTWLYPGVNSVSVVPVGLTKHRQGLYPLVPYDRASAEEVLETVEKFQDEVLKKHKSRVVYPSDEFFILAGREIPSHEYYEDFPQIENGVGMIALMRHEFDVALKDMAGTCSVPARGRDVSIATGVLAAPFIRQLAERLEQRFNGLKVNVYAVENNFFGPLVTVTGLLTGSDIVSQLKGKELGKELLLSVSVLKAGERILLDDYTVDDLESALGVKIRIVENNGRDFIGAVLGL